MKTLILAALLCSLAQAAEPWRIAAPGWEYQWPRDHARHSEFKTEWWYFTGNLQAENGRRFGYQLTFFCRGLRPPGAPRVKSRFIRDHFAFAHFTITDLQAGDFHFSQRISRGAFGESGFEDGIRDPRLAWIDGWTLHLEKDGTMQLRAQEATHSLNLRVTNKKPWAIHGARGVSIKAAGAGHASHYVSGTQMISQGTLGIHGQTFTVKGKSWLDREWASGQLAANQVGWDWFSVQLDDDTELMLYRLRRKDGTVDPASSGSFIQRDGSVRHLQNHEIQAQPLKYWRSKKSGGKYPVAWRVQIKTLALDLQITTPLEKQELALKPVTYWEGMIDATGTRNGIAIKGDGYLEMTGYAGELGLLRDFAAP